MMMMMIQIRWSKTHSKFLYKRETKQSPERTPGKEVIQIKITPVSIVTTVSHGTVREKERKRKREKEREKESQIVREMYQGRRREGVRPSDEVASRRGGGAKGCDRAMRRRRGEAEV